MKNNRGIEKMKNTAKRILAAIISVIMLTSVAFADVVSVEADIVTKIDTTDVFKEADLLYTWDEESAVKVTLADSDITIDGNGATATGSILTITEAGTYVLSGSLSNGQVIVNNKEADIRIVLNGVSISSEDAAPIFIDGADNAYITVAEGTENTLFDKNLRTNSKQDAVIFAEDDLTINGTGSLNIVSTYKIGIHCENDITVCGTVLNTDSSSSANSGHAILGEDSVSIKDATLTIKSSNDGIQSKSADEGKGNVILENTNISIESVNDGIQAEHAFQAINAKLNIVTQAGDGIKAVDSVYIDGENTVIEVAASDGDGIKTDFVYDAALGIENGNIQIMNGQITLNVSKDGIQASSKTLAEDAVTFIDSKASLKIFDGKFNFNCGGEALKSTDIITVLGGEFEMKCDGDAILSENDSDPALGIVNISGGTINITAAKDAVQAQAEINVLGGTINIDTEETAFDSDGSIAIEGGSITLNGSSFDTESLLNYDENSFALMNESNFIGLDNSLNPLTFSKESKQAVILLIFEEGIEQGSVLNIIDRDNNVINSITANKKAKNLFISDSVFTLNEIYGFKRNGEELGWIKLDENICTVSVSKLIEKPTVEPTTEPTIEPTIEPTTEPTLKPTLDPTVEPTIEPTVEPTIKPEFETGDLNGDGRINSKDIAAMQKHITEAKLLSDEMLAYADISGDGKINSRDIALLQKKILG